MTSIAWNNGGPILKNGTIGEAPGCCCSKACTCPSRCITGLSISMGGSPYCSYGFGSAVYTDNKAGGYGTCEGRYVIGWTAEMTCSSGVWQATVYGCGYGCNIRKTATLAVGDDCLPVAGVVDPATFVDNSPLGSPCCPTPPTITVIRT
jgi:hypothetical protein